MADCFKTTQMNKFHVSGGINITTVVMATFVFIGLIAPNISLAAPFFTQDFIYETASKLGFNFGADEALAEGVVNEEPVILASVMGNALISPDMPKTIPSELAEPVWTPTSFELNPIPVSKLKPKIKVPAGTTFQLVVTAYSSTVDQTDSSPFITASGTHVHDGTVAANFLPFGTHVTFPDYFGNKVFTIEDRTNKKYSSRADIWMVSRGAALQFGKRNLRMVVVE